MVLELDYNLIVLLSLLFLKDFKLNHIIIFSMVSIICFGWTPLLKYTWFPSVGRYITIYINCQCSNLIYHDFRPAPLVKSLDLKVDTSNNAEICNEQEERVFQLRAEIKLILSKRKSLEVRKSNYEFFKRICRIIEQEMLSEKDPYSTACRDPYIKLMLEKLVVRKNEKLLTIDLVIWV